MISFLQGTVIKTNIQTNSLILLTKGGVGYEITLTPAKATAQKLQEKIEIYTFLRVTDSAHTLYGFENESEKDFFELLLSVSGVGPKSAMNILALGSIDEIASAIARKDITYLTAVQGMGKKTAERLILELKNKVTVSIGAVDDPVHGTILSEVLGALVVMGYQKSEAHEAIKEINVGSKKTEIVLKEALKLLSK